MRLTYLLWGVMGLAVCSADLQAQLYQQDFSATFPPPVANPGQLTLVLINESGDTITPYQNFPVPGLQDYAGRHQVAARTGGADANQEISAITSTYTLNAVDTTEQYEIDPLPATGGNGIYPPDRILDDAFITLSEDGVLSVVSAVAWDEQYAGGYDSVNHTFAFRISGTGTQANDQADGIGWTYLNSQAHGTTAVSGPGTSEEPSFAGSVGIGFDIYDNGGEGGNSISLHFDGRVLANRVIDPGTTDPNTGQNWAFNSFETDEIITASVIMTPGDPPGAQPILLGGSQYSIWNRGGRVSELIQVGGQGSTQGHLRVAEEAAGVVNLVAFDYDGSGASNEYHASFDFRALNQDGTRADGMSFVLVPTELYGETGADQIDILGGRHEEPSLAGAFGIGFDTFNNDVDALDDPEGMVNTGNHASIFFDAAKLHQENFDLTEFDLLTNDPNVWHEATIDIVGDDVSVIVTDGVDGSQHVVFVDTIPGLSQMGPVPPVFASRTGGAYDHYEIDNFLMTGAGSGVRGDFNNDGILDASDINDLTGQSASGANNAAYDLNADSLVNEADVTEWIGADDIFKSWVGDANLDKEFNSSDLVDVLASGTYEIDIPSVWTSGDFNGDGRTNSSDLVAALADGGYENGPRAAVASVPEPAGLTLLLLGSLLVVRRRR